MFSQEVSGKAGIKSKASMETLLNSGWMLLVIVLASAWFGAERKKRGASRVPFTAQLMLAAILFPAISITDDLQIAQNPAETECSLRQDHRSGGAQYVFQNAVAALPPGFFEVPAFGLVNGVVLVSYASPAVTNSAVATIDSRPPPFV